MLTPPFVIGSPEVEFAVHTLRTALDEVYPNL
jgi:hypothetical protein